MKLLHSNDLYSYRKKGKRWWSMHIKCYHVCMCISHSFFFYSNIFAKKNKYTQFTPTFLLINTINKLFNTTIARISENVTLA